MNKNCLYLVLTLLVIYNSSCKTRKNINSFIFFNDTLRVELPSNLNQGFQWTLLDKSNLSFIDHFSVPNPNQNQSFDLEVYKLLFKSKGKYELKFYYLRPFDAKVDTINSIKVIKKIVVK